MTSSGVARFGGAAALAAFLTAGAQLSSSRDGRAAIPPRSAARFDLMAEAL